VIKIKDKLAGNEWTTHVAMRLHKMNLKLVTRREMRLIPKGV